MSSIPTSPRSLSTYSLNALNLTPLDRLDPQLLEDSPRDDRIYRPCVNYSFQLDEMLGRHRVEDSELDPDESQLPTPLVRQIPWNLKVEGV
jgi:hypothetical protein